MKWEFLAENCDSMCVPGVQSNLEGAENLEGHIPDDKLRDAHSLNPQDNPLVQTGVLP